MFDLAGAKLRLLYEILLFVRNECQLILQFKYAFLVAVVFCLQLTGFNYQRWNIIAIETKQKAFQQLLVDSYTNWAVRLLHFSRPFYSFIRFCSRFIICCQSSVGTFLFWHVPTDHARFFSFLPCLTNSVLSWPV